MPRGRGLWVAYAASAALLWSTIGVAYRYALRLGASSSWLILGRPLVGGIASLAAWVAGLGRPSRWSILVGVTGLAPLIILYLKAVEMVGAGLASILLYTAPIWVTLLSPLVLGERPGRLAATSAALGFTGVVLIAAPTATISGEVAGVAVGLAAGLSYATYILLARLAQLHGASRLETGLHSQLFTAIAVAAVVHPEAMPSAVDAMWVAYLGVATMVVPYILHVMALREAEAYRVAVVSLLEPVSANILAHTILGETLAATQLVGAALILAAAAIASMEEKA